jgi:protein ImuA
MSPGGSSERMAFLRREIARVEGRAGASVLAPASRARVTTGGQATVSALLSPQRLAADLHEVAPAAAPDIFAALGFALFLCAVCARARPAAGVVLAVEDFVARETGAPYGPGLVEAGVDPANLVIVRTHNPRETLHAMEEALKCRGVAAVLGESTIDARLYGLDISRRLTLAARAGGAAGFLAPIALAGQAQRMSSTAGTRMEVARRSSSIDPFGQARLGLPGAAVAGVRFAKARGAFGLDTERVHEVAYDAFSFDLPPLPADRPDQAAAGFSRSA